jgi:hypothetical protein
MGVFSQALDMIKRNKKNKDDGKFNSIPFGLPSLDGHVPGIMKGLQYIITANSGVGKTQLTKFLFVNQPYKFVKEHPELGIKLKILYFALEESKEEFILTLVSNRLKEKYGMSVGVMELRSMGTHTLDDIALKRIEECEEYFRELEESIEIIDSVSNPFGIFKYVRGYATEHGTHHYRDHLFVHKKPDGTEASETQKVYDRYEPSDPNEFVIVIADHISLLQVEKDGDASTLHGAMTKFSTEYMRKMITKHYGYCACLVQQQAADKEKVMYTNTGQSIEQKLEPSLDGLGDNKLTQRDAMIVFGLFAPERYQIEEHRGYNIKTLKDNYRSLSILKNRIGTPNLKLSLWFNGQTNTFVELPGVKTPEMQRIYNALSKKG